MFKALVLASMALPLTLLAGGSDGGGGNGVVCYGHQDSKKVISVELLDFYEGRILEGYDIGEKSGSYLDIFSEVLEKSASDEIKDYLKENSNLHRGFKFLPKGIRLKPIDDSSEIFIPENCKVEQIVNFQGPSRIFVVSDYWNLLSETNKAGLLLHEILWMTERETGTKNSARARRSVARFFADNYQFVKLDFEEKKGDFLCRTTGDISDNSPLGFFGSTSFYIKRTEDKNICHLHFRTLNHGMVFSSEVAELDGCENFLWFKLDPDMGIISQVEVRSEADNLVTHLLTLGKHVNVNGPVHQLKSTVEVRSLEFPNYRSPETQLFCDEII